LYLIQKEKLDRELVENDKLQDATDLMTKIENIVNQAVIETKKHRDNGISNKKIIEDINLNRKIEKRINRQNEAFFLGKEAEKEVINENYNKSSSNDDIVLENDIAMLKEKQRGRMNGQSKENISTERN